MRRVIQGIQDRRSIIVLMMITIFIMLVSGCLKDEQKSSSPPNIILILADDIGVETIGAYGGEYHTPRLDALASNAVLFENAHATPLCTPSRVRLLTGQYSYRNYKAFGHLGKKETTLANSLKEKGYRTAVAGKWQLAGNALDQVKGATPSTAGFDEWLVYHPEPTDAACRYWTPRLERNGIMEEIKDAYGPELINEFAIDFIKSNDGEPFFLYYSMLLAHSPFIPSPNMRQAGEQQMYFASYMTQLDKMVGRLIDLLQSTGQYENTLIIFVGDNGTHKSIVSIRNGQQVRGGKATTLVAGTHVPMILSWPQKVDKNQIVSGMTDIADIYPTIIAAAGEENESSVDGINLLPSLLNDKPWQRETIFMEFANDYWNLNPERFVFDSEWKLYSDGRFFNTRWDPNEREPLGAGEKISEKAQAKRDWLQAALDKIDYKPLTLDNPHFPPGFDREAFDYDGIEQDRVNRAEMCADLSRVPFTLE